MLFVPRGRFSTYGPHVLESLAPRMPRRRAAAAGGEVLVTTKSTHRMARAACASGRPHGTPTVPLRYPYMAPSFRQDHRQ